MLSRPLIFLIRLYQRFISPLKPPSCRFIPTCSAYAIDALREWGLVVGTALTLWRILRCNPFGKGGYDPVPKRRGRKKQKRDSEKITEDEKSVFEETNLKKEE